MCSLDSGDNAMLITFTFPLVSINFAIGSVDKLAVSLGPDDVHHCNSCKPCDLLTGVCFCFEVTIWAEGILANLGTRKRVTEVPVWLFLLDTENVQVLIRWLFIRLAHFVVYTVALFTFDMLLQFVLQSLHNSSA